MGTKRDDIIEFAIGTKIKYNGKLYKVVEQKYCDECSIANLIDIARQFNGDWNYDVTKENVGYAIGYYKFVEEQHYLVCKIDNYVYTYYGNPIFKNEDDAQYVIDNPNFREVLDNIFKV